jgi:hypothetical protein
MPEISEEEFKRLKEDAEKAKALEASKQRLLEESDKYKKRAQEAENKLTEAEKKKLEEEGNLQDLLARERKEKEELLGKFKNTARMTLEEKLRNELQSKASDIIDIDDLMSARNNPALKPLLKLDEEKIGVAGVEEFLEKAREIKPHYFGKKQMPDMNNVRTSGEDLDDSTTKSDDERYREELKKVTTRKELVELKKKFGKSLDSYHNAI